MKNMCTLTNEEHVFSFMIKIFFFFVGGIYEVKISYSAENILS